MAKKAVLYIDDPEVAREVNTREFERGNSEHYRCLLSIWGEEVEVERQQRGRKNLSKAWGEVVEVEVDRCSLN